MSRHHSNKSTTCCPCVQKHHQVSPAPGVYPEYELVEISQNRKLMVQHINPVDRDPSFESHMNAFMHHEYGLDSERPSSRQSHTPRNTTKNRTKSAGPVRGKYSNGKPLSPSKQMQLSPEKEGNISGSSDKSPVNDRYPTPNGDLVKQKSPQSALPSSNRGDTRTARSVILDVNHSNQNQTSDNDDDDIEEIPIVHVRPQPKAKDPNLVIFMLHGVGSSSDIWKAQSEYFRDLGYELVCPDLIGHGFSCAPRNPSAYMFLEIAQDILYIFDKYCKQRNIIIAHSYGASFGCMLARERLDKVSHLVLISGGSPTPLAPQSGLFQWPECCLACCRPVLESTFNKSAFHNVSKTCVPKEKALDVPTYVLKNTMNGQLWAEGTFEYHSDILAHTLLIHGEHDQLISLEEEHEMQEAINGSELIVVNDTSHMVMIEQPSFVNKLIMNFIQKSSIR